MKYRLLTEDQRTRAHIQKVIGNHLRAQCEAMMREPVPERLLELLRTLDRRNESVRRDREPR